MIARWIVVDAYAEHPDQIDVSPYAYVGNNPVDHADPDGNGPSPGGILLGGLALAGGTIGVAAPTGVGEVLAVPAAVVELTGATLIAGAVGLWGILSSQSNSTEPEPAPTPESTPEKLKGSKNPTTQKAATTGQEAHRQK